MRRPDGQKWIGQFLIAFGLAATSGVVVFLLQYGGMKARIEGLENRINRHEIYYHSHKQE